MFTTLLASSAFRYLLSAVVAFTFGFGMRSYQWWQEDQRIEALNEVKRESNKIIFKAADTQIKEAIANRGSVRIEYRDRLRDAIGNSRESCDAIETNGTANRTDAARNDGVPKEDSRTTQDDLIDSSATCYATLKTLQIQIKALRQSEDSMRD
jgi:hypothetical protein